MLMHSRIVRRGATLVGLLLFAAGGSSVLHAEDWYVDARSGHDANDGQSASSAWRTLTHALAAIPAAPLVEQTIHVAPGVYDAALGESFPLRPRALTWIVGTAGSEHTILDAGGAYALVYISSATEVLEATSGAEGLTLRNGLDGLSVLARVTPTRPAFRDLAIEDMSGAGIVVEIVGDSFGGTTATPTGEDLRIEGCGRGVELRVGIHAFTPARAEIELTRTSIRGSAAEGIWMRPVDDSFARARLDRCRVVDNGAHGVYGYASGNITSARCEANASLFARNGGCGLFGERNLGVEGSNFELEDCTVAGNALAGVRGVQHPASLRNCVVAGNTDDLDVDGALAASWSCAGDGDLSGFPHCITADPLYVDAASGDFRLRFGSPCVDVGDPASEGALDLLEHARSFDGDLDTSTAVDIGACEHEPLHASGTPRLGAPMRFELWGTPGASARLFFTLAPLVDPVPTRFGALRLDRPQIATLGTFVISAPPRTFVRLLPTDPGLVGASFSFQAMTSSDAAPLGFALTNAVSFVIEP